MKVIIGILGCACGAGAGSGVCYATMQSQPQPKVMEVLTDEDYKEINRKMDSQALELERAFLRLKARVSENEKNIKLQGEELMGSFQGLREKNAEINTKILKIIEDSKHLEGKMDSQSKELSEMIKASEQKQAAMAEKLNLVLKIKK